MSPHFSPPVAASVALLVKWELTWKNIQFKMFKNSKKSIFYFKYKSIMFSTVFSHQFIWLFGLCWSTFGTGPTLFTSSELQDTCVAKIMPTYFCDTYWSCKCVLYVLKTRWQKRLLYYHFRLQDPSPTSTYLSTEPKHIEHVKSSMFILLLDLLICIKAL